MIPCSQAIPPPPPATKKQPTFVPTLLRVRHAQSYYANGYGYNASHTHGHALSRAHGHASHTAAPTILAEFSMLVGSAHSRLSAQAAKAGATFATQVSDWLSLFVH